MTDEKNSAIKRQLSAMGIAVEDVTPDLQLNGFYFKSIDTWRGVSFLDNSGEFIGKVYATGVDHKIIVSQVNRITSPIVGQAKNIPLSLEKIDEERIRKLLKSSIEGYQDAEISVEDVSPSELRYMSQFVKGDKYIQISHIYSLYGDAHIESMTPACILFKGNMKSMITPIIIKEHGEEKIVVKSNIRLLYAYNFGLKKVKAVIVKNIARPLPSSQRIKIDRLFLSDSKRSPQERYGADFKREYIRPYDQIFRPNVNYLM